MSIGSFNKCLCHVSTTFRPDDWPAPPSTPLTSYGYRRLGPTVANLCKLFVHARLPLGTWQSTGLTKEERAMASAARLPLLYAEGSTKNQLEHDAKLAVWGAVDGINMATLMRDPRTLQWTDVTQHLQESMQKTRHLVSEITAAKSTTPLPSPPETTGQGTEQGASEKVEATEESLINKDDKSTSSESSSSSGDSSSESEKDVSASCWAEFAHGSNPRDRIHFLKKGRLPPCELNVPANASGYGVGREDALKRNRKVCARCCARYGITLTDWSK